MEKKNDIGSFDSIITIDPDTLRSYSFKNNEIRLNKLSGFKKENFYISIISSKNLITDSIEISRNIPDEDIDSAIDIQVYDELNLDPATEHTIFYKEYLEFESSNKRKFNIFAVETARLEDEFKNVTEKIRYIDYVAAEPLLIKSLYSRNILQRDGTDCFLYFKKSDAFLAIYAEGEYVYSKALNFSIDRMHEKFCELTGESIVYEEFINFILTGRTSAISEENQRVLTKLYREMFVYINDIIFYAKKTYAIESVDRVYVNSSIGIFYNIDRYIRTYIDVEPHKLDIIIAKNQKNIKSQQLHNLMVLSAIDYIEEPNDVINFSIFKRPPPFRKRPSGKIAIALLLSLIVSLAYPAFQFSYSYIMKIRYERLKTKERELYQRATILKQKLEKLKKKQAEENSKLNKELAKLNFRKKLLDQIYLKKLNYPMKVKSLVDIFKLVNKCKTKVYKVDISSKEGIVTILISVFSRSDKNITELIKSLTQAEKYGVKTKKIFKDKKKHMYISDIKVVLNDNS